MTAPKPPLPVPGPFAPRPGWSGLGSRHYPNQQAVADRVTAIGRARRVSTYLIAVTGTDAVTGKPTLAWHFDQHAIDAEAATDGWYALLTNQLDLLDLLDIDPRDLR